jgi:hypothetical protein
VVICEVKGLAAAPAYQRGDERSRCASGLRITTYRFHLCRVVRLLDVSCNIDYIP